MQNRDMDMVDRKTRRQAVLENYYTAPRRCQMCDSVIQVKAHEKPAETRRRRFCGLSCAAKFTHARRACIPRPAPLCLDCGEAVGRSATRRPRKYCDICVRKSHTGRDVAERSKGALFKDRKNWQSARSAIRRHAQRIYDSTVKGSCCFVCAYSAHVEIAHIRAVSSFSDDALISEINAPSNLVGLCPNHHWEFDNGKLCLCLQ